MSDDKDQVFVNRHGKKMTLDGSPVDLPVIDEPVATVKQQAAVKPKKVRRVRNKRPVKRVLFITGIVLVAALLVPVIGGELVRARYAASASGARNQLVSFATTTVLPQQKKQVTLAQLSQAADRVETIRDDACDGGLTDNLAMIYPRAKSALDGCITTKHKIDAVAVNLRDMESQVRYLEALAPVLEPVAKPTEEEFAIISAQLANWKAVNEALAKLSPAASQRQAHDQLKTQTKAIVDAWSALNTANDNQDATAFANAEKKLATAYAALQASNGTLTGILNDTQTKLTASYQAL